MTLHSIIIQKLLSTNAHIGRRVAAHHFKLFTYGMRNQLAIIDSDRTLICLRNAASFISHLAREEKARFLFVNTNPLFDEIVEQMTKKIGIYSPRDNIMWRMGGFLTNSFSPKKFRSRNKKLCFGPIQPPDCVVVLDTERKSSVILEADKLQVPIVALVDSSMPWEFYKKIAYPVPANDSVQFVYLFCNIITKTILLERKKLKAPSGNEEQALSNKASSKETQQITQSKNKRNSSPIDEVLIVPYQNLAPASNGNDIAEIKKLLDKIVVVKFNDTLGTAVGFNGPKSSIGIRDGLTSLDLMSLNLKYGCRIPLVLMNNIRTHDDSLKDLEKYSSSNIDILPLSQGQHPQKNSFSGQSRADELYPSDYAAAFLSLMKSSRTLDVLLSQGKEYAHVVSSDNVAAAVDPRILIHLSQNNIEYCMEVTPTTSSLSKSTMVNQQQAKFEGINWWVNLKAIRKLVDTDALKIDNPSLSKEVEGDQIGLEETVASSTIQLFDKVIGINVPQSRFVELNATSDLLLLQSDLYSTTEGVLIRNSARDNPANPCIELGSEFEKVSDFRSRFKSIPSIVGLDSLKVAGDVWFGAGVILKGRVSIVAKPGVKLEIPDGVVLENKSDIYEQSADGILVRNPVRANPENLTIGIGPEFEKIYLIKLDQPTNLVGEAITQGLGRVRNKKFSHSIVAMSMEAGVGVMGTKLGMMSYFEANGKVVPVTVVGFKEGNIVTQIKTDATDGYDAVQVGYRRVRDKKLTKPEMGHLEKAGVIPMRHLQEFRLQSLDGLEVGQKLLFEELFKEGDLVDVSGITIGKGFQGGIKRHHFKRGLMTHGSKSHRALGSIGAGTTPGRVYKGKKMPGRMGGTKTKIRKLKIVKIDNDLGVVMIKGALPGKPGNLLRMAPAKIVGKNIPKN
ncbi:unnamed protein product [Dovyalis caffra]|uniref:Large ribosomal subunit protein uL3c n=1 Tax=Dovyalis caffra TaxID=77055 RepID=A0AAV1RX76_9ROSI|nr:unnamed protein product [Dovyalis caffra]